MRTLLSGLDNGLLAFGGEPNELLFDQKKAVITRDLRLHGGALVHNLEFLRFGVPRLQWRRCLPVRCVASNCSGLSPPRWLWRLVRL